MTITATGALRDLKRLLANGRLAAMPKRHVNEAKAADLGAVRDIDPAAIASDIQAERSRRKQAARPEGS